MDKKESPKRQKGQRAPHHTIKSLRLDLEAARAGKTWQILPEGFRDRTDGSTYPLPSRRLELQKLASIEIPPHRQDCGYFYIRRAIKEWKERQGRAASAIHDVGCRANAIQRSQWRYNQEIKKHKEEARKAVNEVRQEAAQAIASLNDLFSLGRKGIDGQMRAYLAGEEYQGERITGAAFRQCFKMVTQAVKGLGLPSDQKAPAADAIFEEYAASLRDTQETLALAPGTDDETEH